MQTSEEPLDIAGGNANWYNRGGKLFSDSSKKLSMELPCDSVMPLVGVDPEELRTGADRSPRQHYPRKPTGGSDTDVQLQVNGHIPRGTATQWSITQQ